MRLSFVLPLTLSVMLTAFGGTAHAIGQRAQIFETNVADGGIWDHGSEFYLVIDLDEVAGATRQTGVWGGFHEVTVGNFQGEIVLDQFGRNERRFAARAKLVHETAAARYFLIEILDGAGAVLKELVVKGYLVA